MNQSYSSSDNAKVAAAPKETKPNLNELSFEGNMNDVSEQGEVPDLNISLIGNSKDIAERVEDAPK
jgi:hypothetical protein